MNSSHSWWFSLVAASPNPESGEQVNIALLIGNGRLLRLEYDEEFARLRCIAPAPDIALLRQALRGAARELSRFEHLSSLRQYLGPQVRISDPRPLLREPDRKTVRMLADKYLQDVRKQHRRRRSVERVAKIDDTLRELESHLSFGVRIERRVSPRDLYPQHGRIFSNPVPRLDRAIRSTGRDLLIGAVAISPRRPLESMQNPSVRIGRAFWHYREARELIYDLTGRELRTVGLIYNGVNPKDAEAREALEYVAHIWRQDADAVVHADQPVDRRALIQQIDWVSEGA